MTIDFSKEIRNYFDRQELQTFTLTEWSEASDAATRENRWNQIEIDSGLSNKISKAVGKRYFIVAITVAVIALVVFSNIFIPIALTFTQWLLVKGFSSAVILTTGLVLLFFHEKKISSFRNVLVCVKSLSEEPDLTLKKINFPTLLAYYETTQKETKINFDLDDKNRDKIHDQVILTYNLEDLLLLYSNLSSFAKNIHKAEFLTDDVGTKSTCREKRFSQAKDRFKKMKWDWTMPRKPKD